MPLKFIHWTLRMVWVIKWLKNLHVKNTPLKKEKQTNALIRKIKIWCERQGQEKTRPIKVWDEGARSLEDDPEEWQQKHVQTKKEATKEYVTKTNMRWSVVRWSPQIKPRSTGDAKMFFKHYQPISLRNKFSWEAKECVFHHKSLSSCAEGIVNPKIKIRSLFTHRCHSKPVMLFFRLAEKQNFEELCYVMTVHSDPSVKLQQEKISEIK